MLALVRTLEPGEEPGGAQAAAAGAAAGALDDAAVQRASDRLAAAMGELPSPDQLAHIVTSPPASSSSGSAAEASGGSGKGDVTSAATSTVADVPPTDGTPAPLNKVIEAAAGLNMEAGPQGLLELYAPKGNPDLARQRVQARRAPPGAFREAFAGRGRGTATSARFARSFATDAPMPPWQAQCRAAPMLHAAEHTCAHSRACGWRAVAGVGPPGWLVRTITRIRTHAHTSFPAPSLPPRQDLAPTTQQLEDFWLGWRGRISQAFAAAEASGFADPAALDQVEQEMEDMSQASKRLGTQLATFYLFGGGGYIA